MNHNKEIFKKLLRVIPNLRNIDSYTKLTSSGFMDLHVDVLNKNQNQWRIAIAHNYKSGGDMIPDPDMEITVNFDDETVKAETYQDSYVFRTADNVESQKELNEFLMMWLGNLIDQGHKVDKSS